MSNVPSSEIILFEDGLDMDISTEPSHNVEPPHGKIERERTKLFLEGNCIEIGSYKFCSDNDMLNSRLKISVTSGTSRVQGRPLGGSVSDILYRFIGGPPASLHRIVRFGPESFGLVHTYGLSVFHKGIFCEPIKTNPNGKISFGVDSQNVPLIFISGPLTSVDRLVEGWREYEISSLCK
ncbi:MAG: hypothetical protein IPJ71_19290 [Bdellovibrionales bacterium]|nr:hypothetical protein [Bdellovibrionales bacterium]